MNGIPSFLSLLSLLSLLLPSCSGEVPTVEATAGPTVTAAASGPVIYMDPSQPVEVRVEDLLKRMTLEEKIGQMTQVEKNSIAPGDIKKYFVGSILSGGGGSPAKTIRAAASTVVQERKTRRRSVRSRPASRRCTGECTNPPHGRPPVRKRGAGRSGVDQTESDGGIGEETPGFEEERASQNLITERSVPDNSNRPNLFRSLLADR